MGEKKERTTSVDKDATKAGKKTMKGVVGFANLPNQVHRRSVKEGFDFTVMVVGESGLGKSTFINTLLNTQVYPPKKNVPMTRDTPSTVSIVTNSTVLEEKGVKLRLNLIDCPGFGDFINNEDSWRPVLEEVQHRFDAFLDQEKRTNRRNITDTRVHCCLYFISPTGHHLKSIDVEFMKKLHTKVNIIPVIAKSDTLTEEELKAFKKRILDDLDFHKISIYKIKTDNQDDDETKAEAKDLMSAVPFAVVASDSMVEVNGKKVKGRKYPWGVIEVENEEHCDFVKLRQMLIRSYLEDLKETTTDLLYEKHRAEKLALTAGEASQKFEEEKKAHKKKMEDMEKDMDKVLNDGLKDTEKRLKEKKASIQKEFEAEKAKLEKEIAALEEKKRVFEESKAEHGKKKKKSGLF